MSEADVVTVKVQVQSDSKARMFGHDNEVRGVIRLKGDSIKRFLGDKDTFMAIFMQGAESLWDNLDGQPDKT